MYKKIKKAVVIGAGVMGANIAAQLANVGIETVLLDIIPPESEKNKDIDPESREFRDRFARKGLEKAKKASPASFYVSENVKLIKTGNIEDDLSLINEADIVIEAVVEDLSIKRNLFKRLDNTIRPGTIITSNTSGISASELCRGFSDEFRRHFAVTHFFNPPRYMKLLEIVPCPDTLSEVIEIISHNFERVIGKRIVYAKDTPNFVANRIAVYSMLNTLNTMTNLGLTVEAVDALTGRVVGYPKSATLRTADIVGLDTLVHVADNVYENAPDDEHRDTFKIPQLIHDMLKKGLLGEKSGQGFYRKDRDEKGGRVILSLNIDKMEYGPMESVKFDSLDSAKKEDNLSERIKSLYYADDIAGKFTFRIQSDEFIYAANRLPEIADDIVNIDNAMKWGFSRKMGPFEMWDAVGLEESVTRMKESGYDIPLWVRSMLEKGYDSFYKKMKGIDYYYDITIENYKEKSIPKGIIHLPSLKDREKKVAGNNEASLVDLGDGIACLELHSKINVLGEETISMVNETADIVSRDFDGLVISSQAENFSFGANLSLVIVAAQSKEWERLDGMVRAFQDSFMKLKYLDKPVVAAPSGMTLGGGCELCLAADRVRFAAETYIGLVEAGVGLIPAGGGSKELLIRNTGHLFEVPPGGVYQKQIEMLPFVARAFETIALARTSTSGPEAVKIGYLRNTDKMTVNRDFLLDDAKKTAIAMNMEGFSPRKPLEEIRVAGRDTLAMLKLAIWTMHEQGYATDHDVTVSEKIAYVLCGGDIFADTKVSEQYLLDLEREAFLSLCGDPKTHARIQYMLFNGKPLRN